MNSVFRLLLLVILLATSCDFAKAQGIHFSQAYSAHLSLSPANTGRFNGDWRAVGIFRQQGYNMSKDYQTAYFSFEKPFYFSEERLDAGLYYSRDNSAANTFPVDRANLSVAHGIKISQQSRLHVGIQLAWVHKQINMNKLSFPDQYNRDLGGFDSKMPTAEELENSRSSFLDAGIGILYSQTLSSGVYSLGYSLQQINRPKESFFGIDNNLPMKHIWHAKGDIGLGAAIFVVPAVVYIYTGNNELSLAGLNLGYNIGQWMEQNNSLIAGVHIRNATYSKARSLIFSAGGDWQYWSLMLAYDTDISRARSNSISSSGIEISVIYKLPSTDITKKMIKWERY